MRHASLRRQGTAIAKDDAPSIEADGYYEALCREGTSQEKAGHIANPSARRSRSAAELLGLTPGAWSSTYASWSSLPN